MGKKAKIKKDDKPKMLERLALRMASDVYPEICRAMGDLNDNRVIHELGKARVHVCQSDYTGNMEIACVFSNVSQGYTEDLCLDKNGIPAEICPIYESQMYSSDEYMVICEACIDLLENLRKRRLRISEIIDKIDSLPTELSRFVITEKFK